MREMPRWMATALALCVLVAAQPSFAQTQTPPPVPRPFPGTNQPPTSPAKPTAQAPAATGVIDGGTFDPLLAGIPIYQGVQLLMSTELQPSNEGGRAQRLFVFGTNDAFAAVVNFYKTQFRRSGEEVSRMPAIQQFDLGSFDAGTMSQRPSVIVKDYTWPEPLGYLHADGKVEKRFKTLVQVIPQTR